MKGLSYALAGLLAVGCGKAVTKQLTVATYRSGNVAMQREGGLNYISVKDHTSKYFHGLHEDVMAVEDGGFKFFWVSPKLENLSPSAFLKGEAFDFLGREVAEEIGRQRAKDVAMGMDGCSSEDGLDSCFSAIKTAYAAYRERK